MNLIEIWQGYVNRLFLIDLLDPLLDGHLFEKEGQGILQWQ